MTVIHRASGALLLAMALAGPASALSPVTPPPPPQKDAAPRRPSTLDDLFARLAAAKDAEEAKGVASLIERRFDRSGSDTADLLMSRAGEAIEKKDAALAVELLDRVTTLRPDWAQAWNRRATAFYLLDDPVRAMSDLGQALAREPRLYDAIDSLARLELASGNEKLALQAFRRALAIHPFLKGAKEIVDRLAPGIDGRDL